MPPMMKEKIDGLPRSIEKILQLTSQYFCNIDTHFESMAENNREVLIGVFKEWSEYNRNAELRR